MLDVLLVLRRQCLGGQAATFAVDALVIGELAADHGDAFDGGAADLLDLEYDAAVINEQGVAAVHVPGQVLVADADMMLVAVVRSDLGVDDEFVALLEKNRSVAEALDADLRSLQVGNDADLRAHCLSLFAHQLEAGLVVGLRIVRIVNARQVHAGLDQPAHDPGIVGRGAQRGDYLGSS